MDRAAGHYSQCLLLAEAHYARRGNAETLVYRHARCQDRFDRRTSRARSRYGADECGPTDLVAAVLERTLAYAGSVSRKTRGFEDTPAEASCDYPHVGRGIFSGTQFQFKFNDDPPNRVTQLYKFAHQYQADSGDLVRASIYAPSLSPPSFPVICGYSPKVVPDALPQLICVEKDFVATRNAYVTQVDEDCVAQEIFVIGHEPKGFVGSMRLYRVGEW